MRKTSVRRFIHAILDVLPLLIMPIFAININQKSVEPISIEVQENKVLDYQQYVPNPTNEYNVNSNGEFNFVTNLNVIQGHIYLLRYYQANNYTSALRNTPFYSANNTRIYQNATGDFNLDLGYKFWRLEMNYTGTVYFGLWHNTISNSNTYTDFNLFDLTNIYGEGNEVETAQFQIDFTNEYYNYTLDGKLLIPNVTATYDDTDIGSQFLYSLYKPVQDYFNFNNLFNMGQIYDWIQLNLFSGTAPLPIFIIWNIIVYEFFIDLIFLMYSLFMFIIDWSTNMIDKFLYKSRS